MICSKLKAFCEDENLIISDHVSLDNLSTFVSLAHGTTSWLDHIVATHSMHQLLSDIKVDDCYVTSDHLPLTTTVNVKYTECNYEHDNTSYASNFIKWDDLTLEQLSCYKIQVEEYMKQIELNHSLILCDNPNCTDESHIFEIDKLYDHICKVLYESAAHLVQSNHKQTHRQVIGWNSYCKELHADARDKFIVWRNHGSPRSGVLFQSMAQSRAQFKRALRKCKLEGNRKSADALAKKFMKKDTKEFWKSIKKLNNRQIKVKSEKINGATGNYDVCKMWKDHYCSLFNSAQDNSKEQYVNDQLKNMTYDESHLIEVHDVINAIGELKKGKSQGTDRLTSEHVKYAPEKIAVLLKIVFNCMLMHGYLPENFMKTCILSLVKDKKANLSDKDNYRPIAITCVFSKVLELIVNEKFSRYLATSCNQFGFKKEHATDLSVFTLKEIVQFYNSHSSPVYSCLLDSSKAFDRVNHFYLFDKLIARKMPKLIVRILFVWYRTQSFVVRWEMFYPTHFMLAMELDKEEFYRLNCLIYL